MLAGKVEQDAGEVDTMESSSAILLMDPNSINAHVDVGHNKGSGDIFRIGTIVAVLVSPDIGTCFGDRFRNEDSSRIVSNQGNEHLEVFGLGSLNLRVFDFGPQVAFKVSHPVVDHFHNTFRELENGRRIIASSSNVSQLLATDRLNTSSNSSEENPVEIDRGRTTGKLCLVCTIMDLTLGWQSFVVNEFTLAADNSGDWICAKIKLHLRHAAQSIADTSADEVSFSDNYSLTMVGASFLLIGVAVGASFPGKLHRSRLFGRFRHLGCWQGLEFGGNATFRPLLRFPFLK